MKIFNFPYHNVSTEYVSNEAVTNRPGSWTFFSKPQKGFTRKFTLTLSGLRVTEKKDGTNVKEFNEFYREHKTYKPFKYIHPVYGPLVCIFANPLKLAEIGPNGVMKSFDVVLMELPNWQAASELPDYVNVNGDYLIDHENNYIVWR